MAYNKTDSANINMQNDDARSDFPKIRKKEKRPPKKITPTYLHNSGIYYLERFVASKSHFKTVMIRKVKRSCRHHIEQDFDECVSMVNTVADKFEDMGLLDDALYTQGMVTSLRRRGLSRNAIIQKLRAKGIPPEQTIPVLESFDHSMHDTEGNAEWHAALHFAKKKKMGPYCKNNSPMDHEEKQKEIRRNMGRFARAGFPYSIAKKILEMNPDNASEHDIYS